MSKLSPLISPFLSQIPWVRHGFFTREGGVSQGEFASLNAGLGSGDDAAHIAENRARISAHLGGQLITARQVHSPDVHVVNGEENWIPRTVVRGSLEPSSSERKEARREENATRATSCEHPSPSGEGAAQAKGEGSVGDGLNSPHPTLSQGERAFDTRPECDALVTSSAGIALGALTADCVPVLFADTQKRLIAATHSGWGGTIKGVLENTVQTLLAQGATLETLVAVVGPAIAQKSYEVGAELREKFVSEDASYDAFFVANAGKNSYQFALPPLVIQRLRALGITQIDHLDEDTYSQPQRFFSFRRSTHEGAKDYGRQVSAICITEE